MRIKMLLIAALIVLTPLFSFAGHEKPAPPGPVFMLPDGSGGYKINGVPIAFGWAPRHSDTTARDAYWDSSTTARTPVNDSSVCITDGQLQGYTGDAWVDASGWITGPQGDAGDPGTAGADGADGVGTAWETDHTYTADDIVANGGTWYSCTSGHASASATEPGTGVSWETVWELITGSGGTDDQTAAEVPITDAANIITATDTEGALAENRGAIDLLESSASEHTSSVDNPHSVTYAQAGAIEDYDDTVGAGHLDWGTGPNQISAADVPIADASDRYTSTELESALIDEVASENGSGPNASNGKIHWTQLLGVPTGFADGTDDGGSYPGVTTDGSNGLTITGDVGAVDGNFSGSVTIGGANFTGAYTVATIPGSPSSGDVIIVTDGDSACDTTTGSGSYVSWHRYNGASWDCLGDGGAAAVQLDGLTDVSGEGTQYYVLTDNGDSTYSFLPTTTFESILEAVIDLQDLQGAVTASQLPSILATIVNLGDIDFSNASSFSFPAWSATGTIFEGSTADDYEMSLVAVDPTADRTATLQDASGTVAYLSDTQGNVSGQRRFKTLIIPGPDAYYQAGITEFPIFAETNAALTITKIHVECDADPTTEPEIDIQHAATFIGRVPGSDTVVDVCDTTSGLFEATSSFDDADIATDRCIYVTLSADPDDNIESIVIEVEYDFD